MPNLDKNELEVVHINLGRGRGIIRLSHIPTGISVEANSTNEPVLRIHDRLMKELEDKVWRHLNGGNRETI